MSRILQTNCASSVGEGGFDAASYAAPSCGYDHRGGWTVFNSNYVAIVQNSSDQWQYYHPGSPGLIELWARVRLFVERWPSDGAYVGSRVFHIGNNVEAGQAIYAVLTGSGTTGTLTFYNRGNAAVADAENLGSVTIQLQTWHRLEVYAKMTTVNPIDAPPNPPYATNAQCRVRLDGTEYITWTPSASNIRAGLHYSETTELNEVGIGIQSITGQATSTNTIIRFCDFAVDDAEWCGDGEHLQVFPIDLGTYQQWSNMRKQCVTSEIRGQAATTGTANAKGTWLLPSLQSLGVTSETIGLVGVNVFSSQNGTFQNIYLIVNGTEYSQAGVAQVNSFAQTYFFNIALQPDDVVEIGVQASATTTSIIGVSAITLSCETRNFTYPVPTQDVQVAFMTITGDGNDDRFIDTTFKPDFIFISPTNQQTSDEPFIWGSLTGPSATVNNGSSFYGGYIYGVKDTGFYVSNTYLNKANLPYDILLIRDPSQRVFKYGAFQNEYAEDNVDVLITEGADFDPDVLLVMAFSYSSNIKCLFWRYRDHVGDLSYERNVATNPTSNGIQSMGPGTFQIGGNTQISAENFARYYAFNASYFVGNVLMEMVSWTGNSATTRTISLNTNNTPKWVWVSSLTSGNQTYHRSYLRTASHTGSTSLQMTGSTAAVQTAVKALNMASFDVGTSCNTTGVSYSAWVLFEGTDVFVEPVEYTMVGTGQLQLGPSSIQGGTRAAIIEVVYNPPKFVWSYSFTTTCDKIQEQSPLSACLSPEQELFNG